MKLIIGISGASGAHYGVELLKALKEKKIETHLILSEWAEKILEIETDYKIEDVKKLATKVYDNKDMSARISSSSFLVDGMIVMPCSIKTVSEIANGSCSTLITRSADNVMKMKKTLLVGVRETPLSTAVLENLKNISLYGGIVMPLSPGFYHKPKEIKDLNSFIVGKALDVFGIENNNFKRWD
ncbi:MAG: UbiX family flavin prenyltransferase [Candidatus Diapherotrites archaeon]